MTHIKNPAVNNVTIRQARDQMGLILGYVTARHDGTYAGMIATARAVTTRMFLLYGDVSNMNSPIMATDGSGRARWMISPNFRVITKIQTNTMHTAQV